jgi:predicted nucleic-acid-binding Zn-ribbon protein
MSQGERCPKCEGEMVRGSAETLGRDFTCTRTEPKPDEVHVRVQSCYCRICGYIELYTEKTEVSKL